MIFDNSGRYYSNKGIVKRSEPDFVVSSLMSRAQLGRAQANKIVDKLFSGSHRLFLASLINKESLTQQEVRELKELLENYDAE